MSGLNNSFDYKVKLLGLLPLSFDFSKKENYGIRFHTAKLKKVQRPSEDHHDGQVIISNAQQLDATAVAETKIICHPAPANALNVQENVTESKGKTDQCDDDNLLVDEVVDKLRVEDDRCENSEETTKHATHEENAKIESSRPEAVDDKECESKSESDEPSEPVDGIMEEEAPSRFLYKSFSDIKAWKPDFLSYRLPIMFLAMKADPYFFKVNKIRFKPYGCEDEMDFIQIQWPTQLDELYENPYDKYNLKGWSGPMFNKWATRDSDHEKDSSHEESVASKPKSSTRDTDASGENIDSDDGSSSSSYHRAYIQAEIKPKSEPTRVFNILIAALVGGVWKMEEHPENYTCEHLAEMRTVKVETLRENRYNRYDSDQAFFYKRVRMLSNYWQCYLAGETNYLVGVNGPILQDEDVSPEEKKSKREIKELRLYDVSKIPGFIKKCGAEQGFRPWSKEIMEDRLYKSLNVIYDKVIDAPVGTEFMFVKYNEFDPPVHDVDGSITRPYLRAFRQVIIKGLPTPSQPDLVKNLIKFSKYEKIVELFERRKLTGEDMPKVEEKENILILTFKEESIAELFRMNVSSFLRFLKKIDKFPDGCAWETLTIEKMYMKKPVAPLSTTQSWRSSNQQQQQQPPPIPRSSDNGNWRQASSSDQNMQSWRSSNYQQQQPNQRNNDQNWRQRGSAADNSQSWKTSNPTAVPNAWNKNNRRQDHLPGDSAQLWRNANHRQEQMPNVRNVDNEGRQMNYQRQMNTPTKKGEGSWRQN